MSVTIATFMVAVSGSHIQIDIYIVYHMLTVKLKLNNHLSSMTLIPFQMLALF